MSFESENGEDDDSGENGSGAVGDGNDDGVSKAVVFDGHVRSVGDHPTKRQTEREEYLGRSFQPHLEEVGGL